MFGFFGRWGFYRDLLFLNGNCLLDRLSGISNTHRILFRNLVLLLHRVNNVNFRLLFSFGLCFDFCTFLCLRLGFGSLLLSVSFDFNDGLLLLFSLVLLARLDFRSFWFLVIGSLPVPWFYDHLALRHVLQVKFQS